jgi:hypothetical protein
MCPQKAIRLRLLQFSSIILEKITLMQNDNQAPVGNEKGLESLEDTGTVVEQPGVSVQASTTSSQDSLNASVDVPNTPAPPSPSGFSRLRARFAFLNIYLLIFLLVLLIAIVASVVAYRSGKKSSDKPTISSQTLDQKTLDQLANSDVNVGSSSQILNVQSSAIFAGKVLMRDALDVAGELHVGGSLSLAGITVAGTSSFDQVQVSKNLSVTGDTAIQGALTLQNGLTVNGGAKFSGAVSATQLTVTTLQLNGDLTLTHHITAGGPTPSRSNGSALGSGGTSSVSGSDTSGSITINTGNSPGSGCFLTVSFTSKFHSTPHVLLTPIGSASAAINYYVNRSTSSFSVCTINAAPANSNFGFDYFILD